MVVLPQGFTPMPAVPMPGGDTLRLVYTGRFYPFRDPAALLEAVAATPGVELVIAGPEMPEAVLAAGARHPQAADGRASGGQASVGQGLSCCPQGKMPVPAGYQEIREGCARRGGSRASSPSPSLRGLPTDLDTGQASIRSAGNGTSRCWAASFGPCSQRS